MWNTIDKRPKESRNVLAVCLSEPGACYNCNAVGWFRDTVYACRYQDGEYIIQSHGPMLPATHWMSEPELPKDV